MIEFDRITTRGGDRGESSLYNGERRRKDDALFEAMGDVDELSSHLGVARALCRSVSGGAAIAASIEAVQKLLLAVGAQIATPAKDPLAKRLRGVADADLQALEAAESKLLARTRIGEAFVLPGESLAAAEIDVARCVCRRAERRVVTCIREYGKIELAPAQRYLNRLSDYLFVLARNVEQGNGGE